MRILELQRRLREVGRIRIGVQVPTSNGRSRPSKLSTFRLTSRDRQVIDAAAAEWGGTAEPWPDAPGGAQWQVTTDTAEMSVIVPPGDMAFSQAYEVWSAGGCKVRCDGQWDHLGDKPCHCDPEARACDIHTRLSVILPDLPGLGVWRLDTQGYYAAVELGGVVDICASYSARGAMLPARLRLEQREVKRPKAGGGGVETRKFAVPVLDVDVHPLALTGGLNPSTGELAAPSMAALPSPHLTPVPEVVDGAVAPSIAEQVASIGQQHDKPRRSNAQAPLPATGLKPRTAVEARAEDPAPRGAPSAPTAGTDMHAVLAERVTGPKRNKALRIARERAEGFGLAVPMSFDEIADHRLVLVVLAELGLGDDDPPPSGGVEPPAGAAGEEGPAARGSDDEVLTGEVVAGAPSSGPAATEPEPALTARDVSIRAGKVFAADYEAAPRGDKTKVVDRLRHSLVWIATKERAASSKACTAHELATVWRFLREIEAGDLAYSHDGEGVVWTYDPGRFDVEPVVVAWADLDALQAERVAS